MTPRTAGNSIPRLHWPVEHAAAQLPAMAAGENTLEHGRLRYGDTVARLDREGLGRETAPRGPVNEQYWSPMTELMKELRRWGVVADEPLPSSAKMLGAYRDRRYPLTARGHELAELAVSDRAAFTDAVADHLLDAHPTFAVWLEALRDGPIICPFVNEGDLHEGRGGPAGWARWAAGVIGSGADQELIEQRLRAALDRSFAHRTPDDPPTRKAISRILNDAFAAAGADARGLDVDGSTIGTLGKWGRELLLTDQSRYVPAHPSANVIWSACDLSRDGEGRLHARRRGRQACGDAVASALVAAYHEQAAAGMQGMTLAIHPLRARAAFATRTTRALADRVLADIVEGAYPQLGVQVRVFIGSLRFPDSERPAFRHRGRKRMEIQMVPSGTETERSP